MIEELYHSRPLGGQNLRENQVCFKFLLVFRMFQQLFHKEIWGGDSSQVSQATPPTERLNVKNQNVWRVFDMKKKLDSKCD